MVVEEPSGELPFIARVLVEALFQRLNADRGHWVLRLEASDGVLHKWSREERGGATALARFDEADVGGRDSGS